MGFPPANAEIYYNEAGKPTGWDVPGEPEYFDCCGVYGLCVCDDTDEDEDESCTHRNGAIDWYSGAWHCYDCGEYVYDEEDNQDQIDAEQAAFEMKHPET